MRTDVFAVGMYQLAPSPHLFGGCRKCLMKGEKEDCSIDDCNRDGCDDVRMIMMIRFVHNISYIIFAG